MPRVRPTEVKRLAGLLREDWVTPEALAEALILTLDQMRGERTQYAAVLQLGGNNVSYVGMGPLPTRNAAQKAIKGHPAAEEAVLGVVVPLWSEEGYKARLLALDAKPSQSGDFGLVAEDAIAFKRGWRGKQVDRSRFLGNR